ncbi:MAG TPA: hypothetical protein VLZ03_00160, partial [Thermodesulfobacteriota bacterium]|nr:hypothetical protein [Thermodesulfobacteriota bacterium]
FQSLDTENTKWKIVKPGGLGSDRVNWLFEQIISIGKGLIPGLEPQFCEYFGLATIEKKEKRSLQLDHLIRTTPFFDEMFQWK